MTWLTGWTYRRSITITEQSGSDLTDYQVKIELNSSNFDFSKANADGSDIRFAADDGTTLLPYWIEEWDSVNQTAKIWVKIPSLLANSSITIYMYYGNTSAVSESNPEGVFDFFDDFEGTSLDTNKWAILRNEGTITVRDGLLDLYRPAGNKRIQLETIVTISGNSLLVEAKQKIVQTNNYYWHSIAIGDGTTFSSMGFVIYSSYESAIYTGDTDFPPRTSSAASTNGDIIPNPAGGAWQTVALVVKSGEYLKFRYGTDEWTTSTRYTGIGGSGLKLRIHGYSANSYAAETLFDWVRVRKYAAQEPTFTVSAEEVPTISGIVKLSDGTPVSGATVICIREDNYTIVGVTTSQTDGSYTVSAARGVKNTLIVIPSDDTQNGDIKCHIVP